MQQYAGVYLLRVYSTCFGHFVALTLWPVPEAVVTVYCTPDDGRDGRPKHVE